MTLNEIGVPIATQDGCDLEDGSGNRVTYALQRIREAASQGEIGKSCLEALRVLEDQPPTGSADERIELAWNIVNALLYDSAQSSTCIRALMAAFPADAKVMNRVWERRWLTALAVIERLRGNIAQALRAEAAGLFLARELSDDAGEAVALSNLAAHALLSASFDESLQLSKLAMQKAMASSSIDVLAGVHINRGNAYLYLGRYEESLEEAHRALVSVGPVRLMSERRRVVQAKALSAEALIALGRVEEAAIPVESAERWAEDSGTLAFEARRVRALFDVASGAVGKGIASLKQLREELRTRAPSLLVDLLQSEYRAYVMTGDEASALNALKELRAHYVSQAEQTLKGLQETPDLAPLLHADRRRVEIDQYLEAKSMVTRAATTANKSWDFLVALSASSTAPEDQSHEHGFRVGRLASLVASHLGLGQVVERALFAAGLVHDVGKVGVPSELLTAQSSLTQEELALYETHAETGAQLLEQADFQDKRVVIEATRYHHTRYDGQGSRTAPRGDGIPLEARIIAACDALDSLMMGRPSRPAVEVDKALEVVFQMANRQLDPEIVDVLVGVVRGLMKLTPDITTALSEGAEEIPYFASQRALRRAAAAAV